MNNQTTAAPENRLINFVGFGLAWWFVVGPEVFILAATLGILKQSWVWFGGTFLAIWILMAFKWTAWLMIWIFGLTWGWIAGYLVYMLDGSPPVSNDLSTALSQLSGELVVGFVAFLLGLSIHHWAFRGHADDSKASAK